MQHNTVLEVALAKYALCTLKVMAVLEVAVVALNTAGRCGGASNNTVGRMISLSSLPFSTTPRIASCSRREWKRQRPSPLTPMKWKSCLRILSNHGKTSI